MIDADAQGSLIASLGYTEPDAIEITLASVMGSLIKDEEFEPMEGILHHEEGIDLMPGNIELSGLEVSLVNVMSRERIMQEYISMVRDYYDYVLIDCIRNGNTGYLNDFLNAVISEGVREGITDIFGQGVEIDDSEAVRTARRAKELLDKLAEYKPLAKIEELEEQNYNMIDNVLNNGAEKKEQEQIKGRISIKEKLAEKKAVIEQRDKAERTSPEKETEKKSQREM